MTVTIFTERFLLRELTHQDVTQSYLNWFNDAEIKKYILNSPKSLEELSSYIQRNLANKNTFLFGIFSKKTQVHIGNVRFEYTNGEYNIVDMGILIGETCWRGQNVAAEVISKSSYYLKNRFGTNQVLLGVDSENLSAIRAYEKLGFKVEEVILAKSPKKHGLLMVWNLLDC